jgi:hypothetical protein
VGDRLIRNTEVFARGSLDRAIAAPSRVPLVYGHPGSLAERLGYGASFRDSARD